MDGWSRRDGRWPIANTRANTSAKNAAPQTQNWVSGNASLKRLGIGGAITPTGQVRECPKAGRPARQRADMPFIIGPMIFQARDTKQ